MKGFDIMIYVGIDVASQKHDCFLLRDTGEVFSKNSFTIKNDFEGYKKLHNSIQSFVESTKDSNVRIGLESTGHYCKNVLLFLIKAGYQVSLINPILTNMDRKASTVRKTKNDKIDAEAICRFLDKNRFDFKPYTISSYHIDALKSLTRQRFTLVKQQTQQKLIFQRLVNVIFPEFISLFSSDYGESVLNILYAYPTPKRLARAHESSINKLIHHACKTSAHEIIETAKTTIGQSEDYLAFELQHTIDMIRFYQSQVEIYNKQIEIELNETEYGKIITSIPGVGIITGAMIISEIGDINNFTSADQLLAFAGLDPGVYQSGQFEASHTKVSKRGSKYLRWAIHQASSLIWHSNKTFKDYYLKKINEGKHHYVAIGHIDKKLTRVIFSLLKNKKTFTPQK
ncbi:MAG: IS110 family transposase [Acholeplasmatales bacterium]|nr:IS110 family transposase [Acholeplasmatales bacterium]